MSTTTQSRLAPAQTAGAPGSAPAVARGHLRLVPPVEGDVAAARARARAAHPAGKGLMGRASVPAVRPARPAPLRITPRGRLVLRALVVVVMLVVMAVAGLALARGASAADGPAPRVVVHTHVVLPGETLWGIARQVAPGEDPRNVVARIVEFNALPSVTVQAGQTLALPPGLPAAR